ncbi:MAG: hypothetical protein IPP91_11245 [Betaproteobacteria bacterium]|nr:hypothetical protein [Betaproteobacteria bacterium]
MNVTRKMEYAVQALRSIAEHDDAPIGEVKSALETLKKHADAMLAQAVKRRAAKKVS